MPVYNVKFIIGGVASVVAKDKDEAKRKLKNLSDEEIIDGLGFDTTANLDINITSIERANKK